MGAEAQDLRQTLMDVDRAFNKATSAKGIDGWVEFAADDAVFMPEGVDFVRGKEAVRKFYTPMFSRKGFSLTWEPIEAIVAASGDLGYTFGRWRSTSINAEGKPVTGQGKYLTIWKKQKDGSWKAAVDVGNTTPAAAP
jgi:ketosteroid isomerase-like protein